MRRVLGDGYELDDDRSRVDVNAVHTFLSRDSYWARGRKRDAVAHTIAVSARVVGLYYEDELVGFARVVSDDVAIAFLADVYVLPAHRGRGLGVELVREAVDHGPQSRLRWLLGTEDAHELYARFGFRPAENKLERKPHPA